MSPGDELPSLVRRGIGWAMASQGATQVLGLMTSVVVARSMSPRDVGVANEAIVFVALAVVLVDFGFASVVIQRPAISELEMSTLFWSSVAFGLLATLLGIALSGPIADLYGQPQVQGLFAALSVVFLVVAPGVVQSGLLTRDLKFRSLELRTVVATTVSCVTCMVLAVLGAGPWAIAVQSLVNGAVSAVLLWRSSSWRPKRMFSWPVLRSFLPFSSHILGSKLLYWANANGDNFLVGRVVGAAPLGAYSLAFSIALTPVIRIAVPITQVFFPAFSRLREPERIAEVWLRAVRVLAFVVVPLMFGLIVVGPDLVRAVFGSRWRAAGPVTQILAATSLMQTLTALNDVILQSLAQTRTLFRFNLVLSTATLVGFAAGLPWGINGVATGYLIVSAILQPIYLYLTVQKVGISVRAWLGSVSGVLEAGAIMLIAVFGVRLALTGPGMSSGVRLIVLIAIGGAVYVPAVAWRAPEIRREIQTVLERRRSPSTG